MWMEATEVTEVAPEAWPTIDEGHRGSGQGRLEAPCEGMGF